MAPVAALRKFIKEPIQYGVLSRFIDFSYSSVIWAFYYVYMYSYIL